MKGRFMSTTLTTYHLYHHVPDPLEPDAVNEQEWLVNNGATYCLVATIRARSSEDAYRAVREKMTGRGQHQRFVDIPTNCATRSLKS
jgi:hypothetical protein